MDNFDKIIKQKVEQFEVPYNETHWVEMDGKLNSIHTAKIKKNIFGSAAIITVVAISSYFIFSNYNTPTKNLSNIVATDNIKEIIINNDVNPNEENKTVVNNNIVDNKNVVVENISSENKTVVVEENDRENKILNNKSVKDEKETKNIIEKNTINEYAVNAEFIIYNNKVCSGEEVSFESLENEQPVSYTWNFGDGIISHKANPKHIYKNSHIYTVSLTLHNRQTGIDVTTIQYDAVNILPTPKASFSYTEISIKQDDNKLKFPYTTFKIKETDKQNTYKWDFGNGETSTIANARTIYKDKEKNYTATLIVENSYGCVNSSTSKVFNKNDFNLFAANAISPNSNVLENKVFIPKALLGWNVQFEMTIINKSGDLVYKTSDKNEPWNGKMNNSGQILNEGVYLWQVVTYDAEGSPLRHHGKINLIK